MIVIPGRIPITIHPFFWILAALIGWMSAANVAGMLIWIGIIFVSVLFHEFGHALTAVAFKQRASIQLVALGGLTSFDGPKLPFWKQFIIVLNGPLFGFFLFLIATALLQFNLTAWPVWHGILKWAQVANLFWTIANLLPVQPLDGGQLLRIILEGLFGVGGVRASLLIGAILSALLAIGFFLIGALLGGSLFFLFAFQSFDAWRKSRLANRSDQDEENKILLAKGEEAFSQGRNEEAKAFFEQVRAKTGKGILAATAGQYLAVLHMKQGQKKEAYELLLGLKKFLADDIRCLLHQLASEFGNDQLVAELSADCYQIAPSQEMALRSSRAFSRLKQPRMAGGWLQTAWQYGGLDLASILEEPSFKALRGEKDFEFFIEKLKESE